MKAVDTNVLVYAHRADLPQHSTAQRALSQLVNSGEPWFIAWPSAYEFFRLVTHPKIFLTPSSRKVALKVLSSLREDSGAEFLGHGPSQLEKLELLANQVNAQGNFIFDVQIAAILVEHGVSEIITNDSDFLRFKDLTVINPFSE